MGTVSFLGVKSGRGVTLTPHPLLVPWSRKSTAIPLLPLWAVRPVQSLSACTGVHFTFTTGRLTSRSLWKLTVAQRLKKFSYIYRTRSYARISITVWPLHPPPPKKICSCYIHFNIILRNIRWVFTPFPLRFSVPSHHHLSYATTHPK